jgi:arsenite methyltransferase
MKDIDVKKAVKKHYTQTATKGTCCCGAKITDTDISKSLGYNTNDVSDFSNANLGLGCGNPTGLGRIQPGETVLDLGSGPGLDCFLAARKVGPTGHVIGVDMTEAMIQKATANAVTYGFTNVEFRHGDIDCLPIDANSIDVIISNCVINLAPDKDKVFAEAYRVLKPGGRMYISDIVLLADLTPEQKNDVDLLTGCVSGAEQRDDYIAMMKNAGFTVTILNENKTISKQQYNGIPLESLTIEAIKPLKKR